MITTKGKSQVIKAVTGNLPQIANYIVFGVGNAAETVDDESLQFEVARSAVDSISPDLTNQRVVFSGSILPGLLNTVYEVGIVYSESQSGINITLPLPGTEASAWTNSSLSASNARASLQALKVDFTASGTTTAEYLSLNQDLSRFLSTDSMKLAFYATSNVSSFQVRLGTDSANYYQFTVNTPASGYQIVSQPLSSATTVGLPSWSNITYFAVVATGTSGGGGSVYFDAIRFEQKILSATDVLVARTVLTTPYVINQNIVNSVQYGLDVNVT